MKVLGASKDVAKSGLKNSSSSSSRRSTKKTTKKESD